jgi:rubrerythrin
VRSFIQNLPETVADLTDAREAVTEEARLLGMSEEKAMVSALENAFFFYFLQVLILCCVASCPQEIFNVVLAAEQEKAEADARYEEAENDEEADEDGDALAAIRDVAMGVEAAPVSTGNTALVVECSQCSYTLFVAKGREAKFFGPSFKCPDCGAAKDTFKTRRQA